MDWHPRHHPFWWAGGIIIIGVVALLWLHQGFRTSVNKNDGAISVVLSALLVILYLGQFWLDSRRLEFQEKSKIEVQEYETDGEKINIWLSNIGNGVATDIELETCLDFEPTSGLEPGCATTRLRRIGDSGDPKQRVGNSLKAGEHKVRFVGEPLTDISSEDQSSRASLVAATSRLKSEGIDEATFGFFVVSEDLLGKKYRERVFGWDKTVELESGMCIEDVKVAPGEWEVDGGSIPVE